MGRREGGIWARIPTLDPKTGVGELPFGTTPDRRGKAASPGPSPSEAKGGGAGRIGEQRTGSGELASSSKVPPGTAEPAADDAAAGLGERPIGDGLRPEEHRRHDTGRPWREG